MAVEGAMVKTGTTGLSITNVSRRTTRTSTTCGTVARTQWRCRHRIPRPDTSRQWIRVACGRLSDAARLLQIRVVLPSFSVQVDARASQTSELKRVASRARKEFNVDVRAG